MFDKTNDLYVKACVIQNGVTDVQGDTLNSKEIKQIFTSFNNQDNFEIEHNGIPIKGVALLENYISTTDEHIHDTLVPSGSWLIVMKVTCPELKEQITSGLFGGVSLSNKVKSECSCGLTGHIRYSDLSSAECVIPMYISLVEAGANGVGLDIYTYEAYINKSKTGSVKLNIVDELKALIQRAEDDSPRIEKSAEDEPAEPVEEPVIKKADDSEPEEEPSTDSEKEAEDEDEPEEETVINKADDSEDKECDDKEDDAKIEKAEEPAIEDLVARIEALEKIVKDELKPSEEAKIEKEDDEATTDEKEDEEEVAPVITKSAKVVITDEATETKNNFYEMTGRDPITGKKL